MLRNPEKMSVASSDNQRPVIITKTHHAVSDEKCTSYHFRQDSVLSIRPVSETNVSHCYCPAYFASDPDTRAERTWRAVIGRFPISKDQELRIRSKHMKSQVKVYFTIHVTYHLLFKENWVK